MAMVPSPSRRALLRGAWRAPAAVPLRPPWAADEADFVERCTGSGHCRAACPRSLLVRGDGGFPVVDFSRGECDFCGRCVAACASGALKASQSPPWMLRPEFSSRCLPRQGVVCQVCRDQCATGALRFTPRLGQRAAHPEVDTARCTGCGACVAPCPAGAVTLHPLSQSAAQGSGTSFTTMSAGAAP
ncbi:MAG: ferredoxin-type protein NapF [Magnetococcus sp. WYHC-3]